MRLPWRKHKIPCQILWIFRYYAEFIERCYRPLSQLESREMMKTKLVCAVDDPPEYLLLFNFCHNLIFDLYIQVPLRTPMLLRETWIFPKWQDQTFVVNTFILKPLHFPTIIRRVFPMPLSVKIFGKFDLKAGRPQPEWDLNKHIKPGSNWWGKECSWFTTFVPTQGYSLSHAGAAFLMLAELFSVRRMVFQVGVLC